jgi:hypothetical protein
MKTCRKCQTLFDELRCPKCEYARHRRYYLNNREKVNAKNRRNRQANPLNARRYSLAYRQKFVWRRMLADAKNRAVTIGVPFDLDAHKEELKRRVEPMICEMTGVPLACGKRSWNTASLDRIVPELGYTIGNVRIVCWAMNVAMSNWGEDVLYAVVTTWIGKRQREGIGRPDAAGASAQDNAIALGAI